MFHLLSYVLHLVPKPVVPGESVHGEARLVAEEEHDGVHALLEALHVGGTSLKVCIAALLLCLAPIARRQRS